MNEKLRSFLREQFDDLMDIAEETVEKLGEERTWLYTHLADDWMKIHFEGIMKAYPQDDLPTSLVYHDFTGLFKEIQWLQFLFFSGNYPLIYRNLRFVWELLFRAYHADTYATLHSDETDLPGSTAGEKSDWLANREDRLNWNTVMRPTLKALLPAPAHRTIEDHFHPLWRHLSSCVHPSANLRLRMIDESALHVIDNFDEQWATEALQVSAEVLDLVWLTVMSRFPKCLPLLAGQQAFLDCPRTRAIVESSLTS